MFGYSAKADVESIKLVRRLSARSGRSFLSPKAGISRKISTIARHVRFAVTALKKLQPNETKTLLHNGYRLSDMTDYWVFLSFTSR